MTVGIGQRLGEMLSRWLRIGGYWYPRGGIPIDVFWPSGTAAGLWVPDQGVPGYRGTRLTSSGRLSTRGVIPLSAC